MATRAATRSTQPSSPSLPRMAPPPVLVSQGKRRKTDQPLLTPPPPADHEEAGENETDHERKRQQGDEHKRNEHERMKQQGDEHERKEHEYEDLPSARKIRDQRRAALAVERQRFLAEVRRNFNHGLAKGSPSFILHYHLQYRWQQEALDDLVKAKGYDLVYKNVRDSEESRTYVELHIPGCLDLEEPFHL